MKKGISIGRLLFVSVLMLMIAPAAWAAGPNWQKYADGMALSKTTGKSVMIHFYTDDCQYCRKMDKETYADKNVSQYMDKYFISIKVHADREREVTDNFPLRGVPTVWFMETGGTKLAPLSGYLAPGQFLSVLKFVKTKSYEKMTFKQFVEKGLDKKEKD